ncbi:ankyrin repeat-containing protein ITN1-like [Pistacia vera]|uniref:ankyrin repeat-containing protein ITN1-like n=1 Tax=Pistacia vera TaxID=55513 RepID=UPI001262C0CC|nr:ankyrin repeat-containing protein ITN1-like [Pistacia vera]
MLFHVQAAESYVHSSFQDQKNSFNKTPREVFTEEHKDLVKEGEKWMKGTASSCTLVAALIITVVFAAAFTLPGGINNDSIPNFLHEIPFIVFAISDELALFSSTASMLTFLRILTSSYSEDDFLESSPKKLMVGLMTLFFSIASMMFPFLVDIFISTYRPTIRFNRNQAIEDV